MLLPIAVFSGIICVKSFEVRNPVAKALRTISKGDLASLEWFFRQFDVCTYVLFGDKPMAFCGVQRVEPYKPDVSQVYSFMDSICRLHLENLVQMKGWEAWKKYNHLFPSSQFAFLENDTPDGATIVLINKKAFLKQIDENIDYFKEVLGKYVTPQQILVDCLQSQDLLKDVLQNHEGLIGILLGFGRNNAQLFFRRSQLSNDVASQKFSITKHALSPSKGFATLDEEKSDIYARIGLFNESEVSDFNPLQLSLPGFVADNNSAETKQLRTGYTRQYKQILQEYKKGDFLETTLKQYCR
jgi:hypothetical protein